MYVNKSRYGVTSIATAALLAPLAWAGTSGRPAQQRATSVLRVQGASAEPTPAQTIGDVIGVKEAADTTATAAAEAAAQANQALTAALQAQKDAHAELKKDLAATGPVFVQLSDGSITVYIPDASDDGFHALRPVPVTTPISPPPGP